MPKSRSRVPWTCPECGRDYQLSAERPLPDLCKQCRRRNERAERTAALAAGRAVSEPPTMEPAAPATESTHSVAAAPVNVFRPPDKFDQTPETFGIRPLKTAARDGLQAGAAQWAFANNIPRAASRSILGVNACGCPCMHPIQSLRSSTAMKRTFGRSPARHGVTSANRRTKVNEDFIRNWWVNGVSNRTAMLLPRLSPIDW